jgi:hypothetical protein
MVYNPSLYLTLNNYDYSPKSIAEVKECLRTRSLPDSIDTSGKKRRSLAREGMLLMRKQSYGRYYILYLKRL